MYIPIIKEKQANAYSTCINCRRRFNIGEGKLIEPGNKSFTWIMLCTECLYQLYLELNMIFEPEPPPTIIGMYYYNNYCKENKIAVSIKKEEYDKYYLNRG